jgi:cytochrome c-type biogenesis protein CcmH
LVVAGFGVADLWAEPAPDPVDVAKSIMSPVCPGRLIADCPSPEAEQLREIIRRQVKAGKSKQEIINYFVEVYGQGVLPAPPQKGFFLTAWYLPLALMLSGGGIILILVRIWARAGREDAALVDGTPVPPQDPADLEYARRLDEELKEFDG